MSPADLSSSPTSSASSPSPTIYSPTPTRQLVPATPALCSSASLPTPSPSNSSLSSSSSPFSSVSSAAQPTELSLTCPTTATVNIDTQDTPTTATQKRNPTEHPSHTSSLAPGKTRSIYLPEFLTSGVRYFSRQNPSSSSSSSSSPFSSTSVTPLPPAQQSDQSSASSSSSITTGSKRKESSTSHSVVTDIRTINIRDISTVPTLTTFGRKRSKKRDPGSKSSHRHSSSSSSSLQQTSRRKRVKKSAVPSSPFVPWNLCTSSCGCAQSQSPSLDATKSLVHQESCFPPENCKSLDCPAINSHRHSMDPAGHTRTLSESDVQVPDRTLPISSVKQQHPLRNHAQEQSSQDSLATNHTIAPHHRETSERDENQAKDAIEETHHQTTLPHQHSRPQRRKERIASSYSQHKRQRSPPIQMSPFESSLPSSTSSISNMERSKRARHLTSGAHSEEPSSIDSQVESMNVNQDRDWQEIGEQESMSRTRRQSLISSRPQSLEQSKKDIQGHAHPTLSLQRQDSSRIHPLDNDNPQSRVTTAHASTVHMETEPPVHPHDIPQRNTATGGPSSESPPALSVDTTIMKPLDRKDKALSGPSSPQHSHRNSVTRSEPQIQQKKEQEPQPVSKERDNSSTPRPSPAQSNSGPTPLTSPLPAVLNLPITRDTLRELDLFEIFKNPQLRHDIVFDPHLQFRPNFDGERGLIKRREADRFWREVGLELNNRRAILAARRETTATLLNEAGMPASQASNRMVQLHTQQLCPLPKAVLLPRLVDELREILLSLLPAPSAQANTDPAKSATPPVNPERALLTSTLDPELLLQELDHGVLDVHGLFRFLGDSLKGHCAPMRDSLVENMVTIVVDSDEIVRGIRMCFEILEWMKLDIANHQLRTLRPWLLDNSIDFEQKYFTEHLSRGGTIQRTREWFKRSWVQWEGVKQLVISNATPGACSPSSLVSARRPSVASSSSQSSDSEGSDSSVRLTPPPANLKRRSSIISADIGENILDGVVNEGLLEMILRPHGSVNTMPETFELDHYRLLSFHNDFQDLTILCTLLILFRQLAQNCWTQQDLVEIKKVVWLLLTDENANFGSNNTNANSASAGDTSQMGKSGANASHSSGSSGMKDIVIQIEFAARKVRERSANAASAAPVAVVAGSRRSSLAPESPLPSGLRRGSQAFLSLPPIAPGSSKSSSSGHSSLLSVPHPIATSLAASPSPLVAKSLSGQDTNLLTAWLDNALCRTSTLYRLIQKRLLIHFRRWLYLHSCSSMLVLSASCASLASAMSLTASGGDSSTRTEQDEDTAEPTDSPTSMSSKPGPLAPQGSGTAPATPEPTAEETNKAAAEALAAKMSFNTTEMEAHGLTGLEDEMTVLLEKVRAVSEFNKKVYGSWYRDLVKQGKTENWLEV
ncbi:hypothetical protein EMPS_10100 [Entomortierella parvispora]|uniref:Tcp11-domain-containing protein n=1 Tax=Entomortierella parvispora TaxID=205924 RepID=A0A9P3M0N9_9FUNG|nr:hypothetical protein EMPS_10100 [Entomortierella parvispora]